MDDQPDEAQQLLIYRKARQTICDLNGGKEPTRFREWRQIAQRFDIRFHIIAKLPSPAFYYDEGAQAGDLFLPAIRDRMQIHVWIWHEIIEFLYSREVCPSINYPQGWGDHHDLARIVDVMHRRRWPMKSDQMKADHGPN